MREHNDEDQWSESARVLQSKRYQQLLGQYCQAWKDENPGIVSDDDLMDAIVDEINLKNRAELFDCNRRYLDPDVQNITDDLRDDTRHQMARVLAKAQGPKRRLQVSLVDFYMWVDLAMKCREARRKPEDKPTAN